MPSLLGEYDQVVKVWCSLEVSMPIICIPNCFWKVDDTGFFLAHSEHAPFQFVTGWQGPFPTGWAGPIPA